MVPVFIALRKLENRPSENVDTTRSF